MLYGGDLNLSFFPFTIACSSQTSPAKHKHDAMKETCQLLESSGTFQKLACLLSAHSPCRENAETKRVQIHHVMPSETSQSPIGRLLED